MSSDEGLSVEIVTAGRAARPAMTGTYQPKLRILVTSSCGHTCPFCHNEGQARRSNDIDVRRLAGHLPDLRRRFSEATVSGGEPLQSPATGPLLEALDRFGFSITLDTAGAELATTPASWWRRTKNLHCSIISLEAATRLGSCNGVADVKVDDLRALRERHPRLGITINVPHVSPATQLAELDAFIELAHDLRAELKFIGELQLRGRRRDVSDAWSHRWGGLASGLSDRGFHPSGVNLREVEYTGPGGAVVGLADIACASVDAAFADGACFSNMDLTVDPDLNVKLCRWTEGAIPLDELMGHEARRDLSELLHLNVTECPHGIVPGDRSIVTARGVPSPVEVHAPWPDPDDEVQRDVSEAVARAVDQRDLSAFGRDGTVRRLEEALCERFRVPFALTTSSGGSALRAAFIGCGVGPGDEVIVPAVSYPGAISPLLGLGARIRYCDVDPRTGLPTVSWLERLVGPKTKAVMVTHLWGRAVDVGALRRALPASVKVIEDASHAPGGEVRDGMLGTLGDAGCFSLQANKALFAGEGGFVLTASRETFDRMVSTIALKKRVLDEVRDPHLRARWQSGTDTKQKIHPLGAAVALAVLPHLDRIQRQRRAAHEHIADRLSGEDGCPLELVGWEATEIVPAFYRPRVRVIDGGEQARNGALWQLARLGAQVQVADTPPLVALPGIGERDPSDGEHRYRGAFEHYRSTLSLPTLTTARPQELAWYADALASVRAPG